MELRCALCGVRACSSEPGTIEYPDYCPMASEPSEGAARRALDAARALFWPVLT